MAVSSPRLLAEPPHPASAQFIKYNAVLRGLPKLVEWLEKRMEDLCGDNLYVTTLHCINSAIVKLGRLSKPRTVYRGLSGSVLPPQFWKGHGNGGVEFAFMSTTSDRDVAIRYAQGRPGKSEAERQVKTVMEIKMGMIDRGADLQWLSQYPHEREITFAPFTGLEITGTTIEESVLVVQLRLNVNLMSPTIESAVAKMRSAHLQLLDLIHSNLRAIDAPTRVLLSLQGLRGAEKGKEPDYFNRVENFRNATNMALETQHEAFLVLHERQLCMRNPRLEYLTTALQPLKSPHGNSWLASAIHTFGLHVGTGDREEEKLLKEEKHIAAAEVKAKIPEKMRLAAAMCTRAGEHEVALSLLKQAQERDGKAITFVQSSDRKKTNLHDKPLAQRHPSLLHTNSINQIIAELGVDQNEEWKLWLAHHLVELDVPSPWPPTLCRLATPTAKSDFYTEDISESSLQTSEKTCDAIVKVIAKTYRAHLSGDEIGRHVGLPGLQRGAQLLVTVTSQVATSKHESWRHATAEGIRHSISPPETFLQVVLKEGHKQCEYSSRQVARGEVLILPSPNPYVNSGAGALLREAAATGNVKLLKALLNVGVSVWEADHNATTAVHHAAEEGHAGAFELLWQLDNPPDKPTKTHLLRNTRGKRALDFIFENGHTMLARITRGSTSDEEMKQLGAEEPGALEWTGRVLELEKEAVGEKGLDPAQDDRAPSVGSPSPEKEAVGEKGLGPAQDDPSATTIRAPSVGSPSPAHRQLRRTLSQPEKDELAALAARKTKRGVTSLMLACRLPTLGDAFSAVKALLTHRASPELATERGCTALSIAAEMGYAEVVKTLIAVGAIVDAPLADGKTALMLACKNGKEQAVEVLLHARADPFLRERAACNVCLSRESTSQHSLEAFAPRQVPQTQPTTAAIITT